MKIVLKSIELINFKGIRSLTINFNEHVQNILGANETGKSTVFNAFLWLLFGKDMEGRKDYEIKTTDANGKEIPKIEHEVTGSFEINGLPVSIKRILKEKWVKPRGAAESVFSGNETEFFWNDVPCREKDFQEKINGVMKEDVFKLLTNPLYFNTGLTGYKIPDWQARRNVLIELGGKISDADIAAGNPQFEALLVTMAGKSFEDYKRQLSAQKKKVKDILDVMPTRIDEATRAIPETIDFAAISRQIMAKEKEIIEADNALNDLAASQKQKNEEQLSRQNEIFAHKQRQQGIDQEIRGQFNQSKNDRESCLRELRGAGREKDSLLTTQVNDLKRMESHRSTMELTRERLRSEWVTVDGKVPDPQKDDCKCPTCKQDLPADTIEAKNATYNKYVEDFNSNKAKRLEEIRAEGKEVAGQIETITAHIVTVKKVIEVLANEIAAMRKEIADKEAAIEKANKDAGETIVRQIADNQEHADLQKRIIAIEVQIEAAKTETTDNSEYRAKRQQFTRELDEMKKQINTKELIEKGTQRVADLNKEEKDLAQQLAELEGIEFVIQEFTRAQINALEERINGKFQYARFKLFDEQVNGQEVPCCETMYNGVVFGSLNTAAKVLVGIDIINTLSGHYGVSAPIFLDNRESVTSIPDTDAQIINLIVSPADKQLRVA